MRTLFLVSILVILCRIAAQAQPPVAYDLIPGIAPSYPNYPIGYKNMICTYADYSNPAFRLVTVDTATGAKTAYPFVTSVYTMVKPFAVLRDTFYFSGCPDTVLSKTGHILEGLWKWDGVNDPEVVTFSGGVVPFWLSELTVLNNKLYFKATDVATPTPRYPHIYEYDPATHMTKKCTGLAGGPNVREPRRLTPYNNKIYFTADYHTTYGAGELWCYDPVSGTTSLVSDINPGNGSSWVSNVTVHAGKLYFSAWAGGATNGLYEYDGNNLPKAIVTSTEPGFSVSGMGSFNGQLYFGATHAGSGILCRYLAGGKKVDTLHRFTCPPGGLTLNAGKLYFIGGNQTYGCELWRYDAGSKPVQVTDMMPGTVNGEVRQLLSYGNQLYFCAKDNVHGSELFRYKGAIYTSVNDDVVSQDDQVRTYPNPVSSEVYFEVNAGKPVEISICNVLGRSIYRAIHAAAEKKVVVSTNNFPPGVYSYNVRTTEGVVLKIGKLVKE